MCLYARHLPLTQLRLSSRRSLSLSIPLPQGEGFLRHSIPSLFPPPNNAKKSWRVILSMARVKASNSTRAPYRRLTAENMLPVLKI